jgi:DNA-binding response OmpR family regulator
MSHHILIVEDESNEALLYREEFEDAGYEVTVATEAEAALAAVKAHRPDLVVLDINMPGKDGLDLLRELLDLDRKLPVVLNTAYREYQQQFLSWAAAAYVVKSSDPTELLQTVSNVLAGQTR